MAAATVAVLLVTIPRAWALSRHAVTIVHEGAHGVVALLAGRRLSGVRLHADTSGLTLSVGKRRGGGMVLTALAGYLGPAALGLGAAAALRAGHPVAVLSSLLLLLLLLLMYVRNWFGLWLLVVTACGVLAVSWWLSPQVQAAAAYVLAWFLLLAAPRPVLELYLERRRHRRRDSDADLLARLTGLPAVLWIGLFLTCTVTAALVGVRLLLPWAQLLP